MQATITCKFCSKEVGVPGTVYGIAKCDMCNRSNWGFVRIIDTPLSKEVKLDLLMHELEVDELTRDWLEKNKDAGRVETLEGTPTIVSPVTTGGSVMPSPRHGNDETVIIVNIPGWLIVHTPNREAVEFELKEGENLFGRQTIESKETLSVYIPNSEDPYVSRFHGKIEVVKGNSGWEYWLSDNGANPRGSASTNGTYVNGSSVRLKESDRVLLNDGDALQIGETTLRLKTSATATNAQEAKTQVMDMDYEKTVIITN